MTNIVTAKELGEFLRLSEGTVYTLARTGEIPGFKIGDSWRFDMEEVILLIKNRSKPGNGTKEEAQSLCEGPGLRKESRSQKGKA